MAASSAAEIGFRHTVLLTLKPETTEEQKAAIAEGLGALPSQIPQVRFPLKLSLLLYSSARLADLKPPLTETARCRAVQLLRYSFGFDAGVMVRPPWLHCLYLGVSLPSIT